VSPFGDCHGELSAYHRNGVTNVDPSANPLERRFRPKHFGTDRKRSLCQKRVADASARTAGV
jgi:hypothetical protein